LISKTKFTALTFFVFFSIIIFSFNQVDAQSSTTEKSQLPILLDKAIYSWTDIVHIKIIAPTWNTNPYAIETIGDKNNEFIKVATRESKLKPYALVETEPNSGEFVGTIRLTGFLHDADGDKKIDTNPKTGGTGPFDGYLPAKRGDGITVTFETNKKAYSSATSQIKWNVGQLSLDKESYFIGDNMKITVTDPDMNINPDFKDKVSVSVSSDSDPSGFRIDAEESTVNSGIFKTTASLSIKKPTPTGTLYVLPTDTISVKYKDRTLPAPDSISDAKTIEKKILFRDPTPVTSRVDVSNTLLKNNAGFPIIEPIVGRQVQVTATVENKQSYEQKFVYIIQISNEENKVITLSWIEGKMNPYQSMSVGKQWIPDKSGTYLVEMFVWNSLKSPLPLSPKISNYYLVFD
jgi:hypothetical protein